MTQGSIHISADSGFAPLGSGYNVTYASTSGRAQSRVPTTTLRSLFDRYSGTLWESGKHKYNVAAFIHEIDGILPRVPFETFSQTMFDDVVGVLRERGNSNATINRKIAALSKLLRKAVRMGDIQGLPEFKRQKERAGRIRFLEAAEEDKLFAAIRARSESYYLLSVFLVDTGARLGEAIDLRWNDLNKDRATFWLTKSGRSRSVPLTARAIDAARVRDGKRRGPFNDIVQYKYRAVWNDAKAEVGLGSDDQVVPHILRHTCASRLVRGGVDIRRVQMWLGHQTLQMTMRYAHLATNDLDMCVPILERR